MIDLTALAAGAQETEHTFYHKGGDARARDAARLKDARRQKVIDGRFIFWDSEGIDLSGPGKPQHCVLWGCSAEVDSPLIITQPGQKLTYKQICEYVCDVGSLHPGAKHVGFGFRYDQNMLVGTMPTFMRRRLYETGRISFRCRDSRGQTSRYYVHIVWGKFVRISRKGAGGEVSVRIDDIISFFHTSFLNQYKKFFPDWEKDEEFALVVSGKARRGVWSDFTDLAEITAYWRVEITRMERMISYFRDLMVSAGIYVHEWHGPGAVANFIRRENNLNVHEWGGKEANLLPRVHEAVKHAYFGGRFEQGLVGRIQGPVYGIDINSAYPYALTKVPTLQEGGFWQHVEHAPASSDTFGVYRVRYHDSRYVSRRYSFPQRSEVFHPLPHRTKRGQISYPSLTEGWYWAPEVRAALDIHPDLVEVYEGYEWRAVTDEYPWRDVLEGLYEQRHAFKRNGNPAELAVKLAINSLYGKMAQRVGYNPQTNEPPRSHTLCVAGFVTAYCRAMIYRVVAQIPAGDLVAIETDAVYTRVHPDKLDLPTGIGKGLGEWGLDGTYDELMYVQSGVYAAKQDGRWLKLKTRGFSAALVNPPELASYLESLKPDAKWLPMQIEEETNDFIGLGLAILQAGDDDAKLAGLHCQWKRGSRQIDPGGKGKRAHVMAMCRACREGHSALDGPHTLVTDHGLAGPVLKAVTGRGPMPEWNVFSAPHVLPWESSEEPEWRAMDDLAKERMSVPVEDLERISITELL
jgi:hypothetical protein